MTLRLLFVITTIVAVLLFYVRLFGIEIDWVAFMSGFRKMTPLEDAEPVPTSTSEFFGVMCGGAVSSLLVVMHFAAAFAALAWAGERRNNRPS